MYKLFLATRYTLRRGVSIVAIIVMGLAIGALIVVWSIMTGFLDETRDLMRGTTSDLIVLPQQYARSFDREDLERTVRQHPDVVGVTSRIVRPAVFNISGKGTIIHGSSSGAEQTMLLVHGIDPEQEREHGDFPSYLANVAQSALHVGDPENPFALPRSFINDPMLRSAGLPKVLMSELLMGSMGLVKGDAIELVTVPDGVRLGGEDIRPAAQTFVIAGAFSTDHYKFDAANVFVPREAFRDWCGTKHELTELYLSVREGADLDRARDEVEALLSAASLPSLVDTWEDRHRTWLAAVENERMILLFVFGFFLMLVSIIILCMLMMLVNSKVRDIGILASLGASPMGISGVFALCGVVICTLGGLAGLGAGVVVANNLKVVQNGLEALTGKPVFDPAVYAFTEVPSTIDMTSNWQFTGVYILIGVAACLGPALVAGFKDPVKALRHE